MTIRAVSRSLEEKETNTHNFMHKTMEGTLVIVNGNVEDISLSLKGVAYGVGNTKAQRVGVLNLKVNEARSLYLVLRSMLSIIGDLEELDECAL